MKRPSPLAPVWIMVWMCVFAVRSSAAQTPPSPAEAQRILEQARQNPAMAAAIRARLQQSGMSPEQIRARLRASGYSESLLDAYLEQTATDDSLPSSSELAALEALGLPPLTEERVTLDTGVVRGLIGPASDVFGVDVFRRSTTQFLPLLAGPVPPDYRLGPGDKLVLILTGDVELAHSLQVNREGFVFIPQVGQVHAANLTLDQLRNVLFSRLGRVYSGVRRGTGATTQFDVTVANVRANQVFVVGEVVQPGAYQISSLATVLTALYAGGGVTDRANLRRVEVHRLSKTVATLDLYEYLLKGNTRSDVRLETGDVVFVPVHGTRVTVKGAVIRPAIYDLAPGETLADLLNAAGGFTASAARERLKVERILPAAARGNQALARVVVDVPLPGAVPPPFVLENGDVVEVDSLPRAADQYVVSITGHVHQWGIYPWHPGMTLRELMLLARGPRIGADLREAEIARLPTDRSRGQLATTIRVPMDSTYLLHRDSSGRYLGPPGVTFLAPGAAAEVPLEPYDNVLILRQPDFELQRNITIRGEVQYPGTYALRAKDDRLADLIVRAGGLTPRAYPEGISFVRPGGEAGRINIDLARALRDKNSRDNIILQPGDSVRIPEYQPSVKVTGAVNSPGSVLYRQGAGLDYYLSAAGGFKRLADKGAVSVRFANGEVRTKTRFLMFTSAPSPGPGSEVQVPSKNPNEPKTDPVLLFGAIAQILASTMAIIIVATR